MEYYLAVDIGGTHLRTAVGTRDVNFIGRSMINTPKNPSQLIERLIHLVKTTCDDANISLDQIYAVGIGIAGIVDKKGNVKELANVQNRVTRKQLINSLQSLVDTNQIIICNDATAGVIGEYRQLSIEPDNMVYITFSTGIGAGIIYNGNCLYGNVGEVGHFTVDPTGTMQCGCGKSGHWEAYCGGKNIPHYATHLHKSENVETILSTENMNFTSKDVFEAAESDELAALVIDRIGMWNTFGIANVVQAFSPEYIAVGGSVAINNPNKLLDPVFNAIDNHILVDTPDIRITSVGEDVVLYGCQNIAIENFGSN